MVLILSACHSSRPTATKSPSARPGQISQPGSDIRDIRIEGDNSRALVDEGMRWLGTPYKYGGNTRRGTDCSGFTSAIFLESVGIKIPRDSRSQQQFCEPVSQKDLRTADLLFFTSKAGADRISHVGMYIGDRRFIHASTSRGVIISSLDENYYTRHYHSAGRVPGFDPGKPKKSRQPKESPAPPPPAPVPAPEPASRERILPLPSPEPEEIIVPEPVTTIDPEPVTRPALPQVTVPVPAPVPASTDSVALGDSIRAAVRDKFRGFNKF